MLTTSTRPHTNGREACWRFGNLHWYSYGAARLIAPARLGLIITTRDRTSCSAAMPPTRDCVRDNRTRYPSTTSDRTGAAFKQGCHFVLPPPGTDTIRVAPNF